MKKNLFILTMICLSFTLYNCGSKSAEEKSAEAAEKAAEKMEDAGSDMASAASDMEKAAGEMAKAMQGLAGGKAEPVVEHKKLKELLPQTTLGMTRTEYESEAITAGGFQMSNAKAAYEKSGAKVRLNIIDTGGAGMAMMGMAAWATISIDKETENGYERTSEIDGYKSFERYNRADKNGEISVLVAKRFIVTANGDNVEESDMQKAIKSIDLSELAAMK